MKSISLIIAYRYLIGTKNEKSISSMIKIAFFTISLGTFALALIISIMNGFESITYEKLQNIHPQITMQTIDNNFLNFDLISKVLKNEFPDIEAFAPTEEKYVIINNKNKNDDITNIMILKGIDPELEQTVNNLQNKITASLFKEKNLNILLKSNQIIIGQTLAKNLDLEVGDQAILLMPDYSDSNKINLHKTDVIISGLFNTGMEDFDNQLIICSLDFLLSIFPDSGITKIGIKLKKNTDETNNINILKKRFKFDVYSWKELYPDLVSSLKLEKYVMFFILALIILIGSTNIISLLFMIITQKRRDIAIFKSMGFDNRYIQLIFISMGLIINFFASIVGLIFAYFVGKILEFYPFIKLPDVYYASYLPIKMEPHIFLIIFFTIILIGFVATYLPTKKISYFNIAQILKNNE